MCVEKITNLRFDKMQQDQRPLDVLIAFLNWGPPLVAFHCFLQIAFLFQRRCILWADENVWYDISIQLLKESRDIWTKSAQTDKLIELLINLPSNSFAESENLQKIPSKKVRKFSKLTLQSQKIFKTAILYRVRKYHKTKFRVRKFITETFAASENW